jgi:hypothetical protein
VVASARKIAVLWIKIAVFLNDFLLILWLNIAGRFMDFKIVRTAKP